MTYTLEAAPGGTHFTRGFDYPSRSILFAFANAFVLRPRIADESKTALENLKRLLDADRESMPIARH